MPPTTFNTLSMRARIALIVLMTLGIAGVFYIVASNGNRYGQNGPIRQGGDITITRTSEEQQVIEVVKKANGAVVSIIASAEVPRYEQCFRQSPLNEFFKIPSLCQEGTEVRRVGAGTGFFITADGYIITNKHVVADEEAEYTVVLNGEERYGQKFEAEVLARHPENDIAILKVDIQGAPFLHFGDSNAIEIGQTAIAIGYSLGEFDNTVSKGVVSGLSRSIEAVGAGIAPQSLSGLIQTDAAINPGNSGGPLLDSSGNIIGMNVAVANAQSIGFAIPVNDIKSAYDQVRETGMITVGEQAFLGVRYTPVTAQVRTEKNLPYNYGMLVVGGDNPNELAVVPGSPAAKAGIKEGDLILSVNKRQLNERNLLADAIRNFKPGDVIELLVYQNGAENTLSVRLGERP